MARFSTRIRFGAAPLPPPPPPPVTKKVVGIKAKPAFINTQNPGTKPVEIVAEFEDGSEGSLSSVPNFNPAISGWVAGSAGISVTTNAQPDGYYLVFTVPTGLPEGVEVEYGLDVDIEQ